MKKLIVCWIAVSVSLFEFTTHGAQKKNDSLFSEITSRSIRGFPLLSTVEHCFFLKFDLLSYLVASSTEPLKQSY